MALLDVVDLTGSLTQKTYWLLLPGNFVVEGFLKPSAAGTGYNQRGHTVKTNQSLLLNLMYFLSETFKLKEGETSQLRELLRNFHLVNWTISWIDNVNNAAHVTDNKRFELRTVS